MFAYMKKYLFALAALSLLFACTPENNNNGGAKNNEDELTITGEALNVTAYSATLTGYANLPFELGDAKVGIMYDKQQSFEDARKVVATGLDGNNKFTVSVTGLEPSTTYYYKSYVQNGMAVKYGSVKSFVTVTQRVTSISLDKTSLSLVIGAEATLYVTSVLPDNANDKTYSWSSSDSTIASVDNSGKITAKANGKATIKATANDGSGVFASCSVIVLVEKVDMGIKTSDGKTLYWSTRNLCESGFVNSPEDCDYYAWGETAPYYSSQSPLTWKNGKSAGYNWSTYKWYNGSDNTLTKYNTKSSYGNVDNKTVLESSDDVASVKLGGRWRMPTDAEWTELRTKCTWTWTENYNGTGVAGEIVTAPNGNSIFLPAAGGRGGTSRYNAGSDGYYWSSSLDAGNPYGAWYVYFDSDNVHRYRGDRCSGLSVRPVTE